MESGLNPNNITPPGAAEGARGLMQVTQVNRVDYNQAHGTAWSAADMLRPRPNVKVFADTVGRMLRVFRAQGLLRAGVPTSPAELLLVTAGWNSGYGDLVRIARWLRDHDRPITHDNLFRYAPEALSDPHRWTDAKRDWQRRVVQLYETQPPAGSGTGGLGWILLLLLTMD